MKARYSLLLFVLIFGAVPDISIAADKELPPVAQQLKAAYMQAVARSTVPLQKEYETEMNRLLQKYTQAGKLDEVMALKAEIENKEQTPAEKAKLPLEARKLKEQQLKSISNAVDPLRRNYVAELDKLVVQATRAGHLEEALAIKEEMQATPVANVPPFPAATIAASGAKIPPKSNIILANATKAREAAVVLAAAQDRKPALFRNIKYLELIQYFDFAEKPMNHHNGAPDRISGAYSKTAWTSAANGMITWGPSEKLDEGKYLIVYRVRLLEKDAKGEVAFLDVAHSGVTRSGERPKAEEVPPGTWHEIALPLTAEPNKPYEYRVWGSGKKIAMDRVYVFKVKANP